MKHNPFRELSRFDWLLWGGSIAVLVANHFIFSGDPLSLIASLIGISALIFCAKGLALGQFLIIVFAVFYGMISFAQQYYGEMITYLGMSAPIAVYSLITWLRHPYKSTAQVEIHRMTKREWGVMALLALAVTAAFYFILRALGNASLLVSTLSVTTSFLAAYLCSRRSPFYAMAYAINDAVLIVLWVIAAVKEFSCLSMVVCFSLFFLHDMHGFFNWLHMQRSQNTAS